MTEEVTLPGMPELPIPKTAEDVRAFLEPNFSSLRPAKGMQIDQLLCDVPCDEGDMYTLSAHDLLSAFARWAESLPLPQAK
jgi:hypothetical protein